MTRPLIGITTYREPAAWGTWAVEATLLPASYTDAVRAGGGTPLLIPPLGPGDDAAAIVGRLDGLLLAGGADVNPSRYSQTAHPAVDQLAGRPGRLGDGPAERRRRPRHAGARRLPRHAGDGRDRGRCPAATRSGRGRAPDAFPGPDSYGPIEVRTTPGSRLAAIIGPAVTVACHHHQAVAEHPGFVGVAHADDGLLEAMETPGDRFRIGGAMASGDRTDLRLFEAFAAAARDLAGMRRWPDAGS